MQLTYYSTLILFYIIIITISMATNVASTEMTTSHHDTSCFLDATITSSSSSATINTRKRSHSTIALYERSPPDPRRERPPRRRRRNGTSQQPRRRQRNGLSNICPPLDGTVGAPQLPVVTTKDPAIIARWLEENIGGSDTNEYSVLGYDQETTAKPPWKPERANLPDGPATVQLSTTDSCLIVQLAICGDGSAIYAPEILRQVINNPRIIKVGVGIDDDALELFRWSRRECHKKEEMLWKMRSRFDIGCILPDTKSSRRAGLRELAQKVLGVEVPKSKKLAMSNWSKRHLTQDEISYAARDAWVAAAIVDKLQQLNSNKFAPESLVEMDFIKSERCMSIMDERAKRRKAAKVELKEIVERQKANGNDKDEQERQQELYNILDMYRPDHPPTFNEDTMTLELF